MILLTAKITIYPEKRARFLALASELIADSRKEVGCHSYELFEDAQQPNVFLFLERWQSQAHLDAHFKTPHFQSLSSTLPELSAQAPVLSSYEVDADKASA